MNIKKVLISAILALSLLLLPACNKNTGSSEETTAPKTEANGTTAAGQKTEYKYGKLDIQSLNGGVCGAPAYIAYEKGFFAEEGLDVSLVSGTFETQKAGLASGNYTVANGDFQFFPSVEQGLDIRVIGGLHVGCIKIVVPPNSPIKTAADLKGKKIGIDEPGGTPQAVASVVLSNAGIDPQTGVEWITYPLDQLTTAVEKGEVDAFAAWDPFGTLAVRDNGYRVISDLASDPLFAGKTCCFLYASQKQIDKNPERVAAIVRAYQKSNAWIRENFEDAAKLIIEKDYVSTDDVALVTELLKSYEFNYATDEAKTEVEYFAKELKKTGFLSSDIDPKKFADDLYYDALGAVNQ